jgi:hypothetical protein
MRPADHGRLDRNGTELSELRSQAPRGHACSNFPTISPSRILKQFKLVPLAGLEPAPMFAGSIDTPAVRELVKEHLDGGQLNCGALQRRAGKFGPQNDNRTRRAIPHKWCSAAKRGRGYLTSRAYQVLTLADRSSQFVL